MKLVKITEFNNNKQLTCNKHSYSYLNPKYIYIPLNDNNEIYNCLVQENDYIKIGQIIAVSNNSKIPIHSSISGYVTSDSKKMWTNNGKLVNCIEIKNDYLNESIIKKETNDINKDLIINIIKNNGIVGMGGAGFPTYKKYLNDNVDYLIVNGCECELFVTCDYRMIEENVLKLISGINYLKIAFKIKKIFIATKKENKLLIEILNKYCDDFISIYCVPNKYPVGYERYLVKKILHKNYTNIPIEVNCIVNNASTIIAINDAIKYNIPLIERMVTFSGYCLEKPINILCKIGTNIEEIINEVCIIKHKYHKKHIIVNGVMSGKSLPSDNIIVTKTLNSIVINPYLRKQNLIYPCIGCGNCAEICPNKLTPTQIIKNYKLKNVDELKLLKINNCIQCGLCSYICPSRIDLMDEIIKCKKFVKGK